jgi:DNA-binding beta-propeller fold protein YncE
LVTVNNTLTTAAPYEARRVSRDGKHLYVGYNGTSTVAWLDISATGTLTAPSANNYVSVGSGVRAIATTSDGKYLYVVSSGNKAVSAFSIGSDGLCDQFGPC